MNNRRKLVIVLGAGALAAPFETFAQPQGKVWRIGFLSASHVEFLDSDVYYGPFRQGMRELGYVEGKNLIIEWRSAEGQDERLAGLAAELVNLNVDLIVATNTPATRAAQKATTSIPIVMGNVSDPVRSGFVNSLARPAGNITGLSTTAVDFTPKQFEMLLAMVPKLSRLAVLLNPTNSSSVTRLEAMQVEAQKRGVKIIRVEARTPKEIDDAFSQMRTQDAGALFVLSSLFNQQKDQIAELAAKNRLPAVAGDRIFTEAGILMSYGPGLTGQFRRTAAYVDKIFKGAKPADLPVEQPMTLELFINGKTAKTLGLKIPNSIRVQATKIIE